MAKRTAQSLAQFQGTDLHLDYALRQGFFEDADLGSERKRFHRDLAAITGIDNLAQAIVNRLKTRRGELASLGHPNYGSRHHELIGEPNVERTRNLVKLYVLQALRAEPRIERVLQASVRAEHDPPRETVRIELEVRVLGQPERLNLAIPFSLEADA